MLSNFVKNLMFARQFYINEGKIEIMKINQVMLSSSIIYELQDSPLIYEKIKKNVKKEFHEISNNFGSERTDLIRYIENIFDIYGLGKIEVKYLSKDEKTAKVNVFNSSMAHTHISKKIDSKKPVCNITSGVIAGLFSFIFDDDIDCSEIKCFGKGDEFCEFDIKRGALND